MIMPQADVIQADADWNHFPYPENFWTSLVALGFWEARNSRDILRNVPIWWEAKARADGTMADMIKGEFHLEVLNASVQTDSSPDIQLVSRNSLIVVETKLGTGISGREYNVFDHLAGKNAAYLLMAPGSFNPGQLGKFYARGRRTGVRAGFLDLAKTVNWAWSLLELGPACWPQTRGIPAKRVTRGPQSGS